ncbi:MAG: hypothetical protein IKT16_09125, partial [Desulfovibrio sp.]|nr:hypothetical protein [Desulfovibrio sp.]
MSGQDMDRAGSRAAQDADQAQTQAQGQAGPAEAPDSEPSWMHSGDEETAFELAYGACGEDRPQAEADAGDAKPVQEDGQ